jgi:GGDEF domain-containing protein
VRGEDFVIRCGGDEFLIVLPETVGQTNAIESRILAAVSQWNTSHGEMLGYPLALAVGDAPVTCQQAVNGGSPYCG